MAFNIDIAIVALFLVFTMIIGFGHGRKVQTIQDYALGGRDFSTAALVATIVATWVSGGSFSFYMAETYEQGISFILAIVADALSFVIIATIFVPKMQKFIGKLSVAEVMGDAYGKDIRIATAITGFIGTIGALAVQFKIFSSLFGYFLNFPATISTIVTGLIVISYSTFGGIRSVTFTDLIQIITFSVIIPIIVFTIWQDTDGFEDVVILSSNPKFNIQSVLNYNNPEFWSTIAIFIYFLVPGFSPSTFQRIAAAKNINQSKSSFLIASIYLLVIELLIAIIAILIFIKDPNLDSYGILNYIIDNYAYTGLKGLIVVGIIAMVMSTADSYISSSAVLFSHDFCKPLGIISKNRELLASQIFCLFVGVTAIILAINVEGIFSLFVLGYGPYMTIVTVPFMLLTLGFKANKKSIIFGMICGMLSSVTWKYFSNVEVDDTVLGMLFNLIAVLLGHFVIFGKNNSAFPKTSTIIKKSFFDRFFSKNNFGSFFYPLINSRPKEEYYYPILAFCFIISIFSIVYSIPNYIRYEFETLINNVYISTLVFSSGFLTFPLWSEQIKKLKYIHLFWLLGLIYNMAFITSLLVIISNFGQIQLIMLLVNFLILTSLLCWRTSLFSILIGILCSFKLYEFLYGAVSYGAQLKFLYLIILTSGILFAFIKPKQEYQEETEAKVEVLEGEVQDLDSTITALQNKEMQYQSEISSLNEAVDHYSERVADQAKEIERLGATAQKILNNVNHELRLPVGNVMNFAEMLYEGLGNYSQEQLKELTDEVYQNSTRLSTMILNMLDLATLDVKKVGLVKSTENFSELVRDRVKICRNIYLQGKPIDFKLIIEPEILISIDPNYMRQVVDNLVINAINFSEKGTIEIEVRRNDDAVVMTLRDQGKGIPREELFDIFKPFKMGSNSECQSQGRGVGLALCKSAVEAHGGSILAESPGGIGALFTIILMR